MITVLFFGPVAARVGQAELTFPASRGMTLQHLHHDLQQRYPHAFELVCCTALNGQMHHDLSQCVRAGDEVVFMSKFSGG